MEVFHNFITLSWLDHCHLLGHPIYLGKTNINKFELILVSNYCRAHFLKCACCYLQLFRTYTHFNYCLVDHLKSTKTFNCYSCSNPAESSMYPGSRKKCVILHPDLHPGCTSCADQPNRTPSTTHNTSPPTTQAEWGCWRATYTSVAWTDFIVCPSPQPNLPGARQAQAGQSTQSSCNTI